MADVPVNDHGSRGGSTAGRVPRSFVDRYARTPAAWTMTLNLTSDDRRRLPAAVLLSSPPADSRRRREHYRPIFLLADRRSPVPDVPRIPVHIRIAADASDLGRVPTDDRPLSSQRLLPAERVGYDVAENS